MTEIDLESVRSIDVADVYKAGRLAAQLRRVDGGVSFAYLPDSFDDNIAVAVSLPVSAEPVVTPGGAVPPFFAGLLPEGRRLAALRQAVKTSADDELSLLLAVGRDPIGDVQVVAAGERPSRDDPLVSVEQGFGDVRFADVLEGAGVVDPSALPGVQAKGSAKGLSLPIGVAGDRYVLKIDPPEHPHIVANEAYFLGVARSAALPTVEWGVVVDADGREGLLVKRFDRVGHADGSFDALACEDACQLLGRWPADKYNVSSVAMVRAVADATGAPVVAARDVFRQIVLAWLTGNGDLHAKNVSVLSDTGGERRVAPAYDVPSTVFYGDLTLALSIDGRTSGVSRRRLVDFASAAGVRERAASRVIDDLLEATAGLIGDIGDGALPFDEATLHAAVGELRNRRRLAQG